MRAAVLDTSGVVVNVIEYDPDGEYDPGPGRTVAQLPADAGPVSAGWTRKGKAWQPPAEVPPAPAEPDPVAALVGGVGKATTIADMRAALVAGLEPALRAAGRGATGGRDTPAR